MFARLNDEQIQAKVDFITQYMTASNAASGSAVDANANVTAKNIATLEAEINKDINIQVNRKLVSNEIAELFGEDVAKEYNRQIEDHEIYVHDETSLKPYCCSVTMYPFLLNGITGLGGESKAPQHIESFCGSFVNLVFALSSQQAGACLYKTQELTVSKNGKLYSIPAQSLIAEYLTTPHSFSNYQGDWEYQDVRDQGLQVWENGQLVNITKVYRRKYAGDIYTITTKSGKKAKVSADHVFKVLFRGRELEVKAKDLQLLDTVYNTMNKQLPIDKNSDDYKHGQFVGIIAGDGSITQDTCANVSLHESQEYVVQFLNEYTTARWGRSGSVHNVERAKAQHWQSYYVGSTNIVKDIRGEFSSSEFSSHDKNISIEDKSLDFLAGFLDGILVTDGGFGHNLSITLSNKALIETIYNILAKFNISASVPRCKPAFIRDSDQAVIKDQWTLNIPRFVIPYLSLVHVQRSANAAFESMVTDQVYYYGKHAWKMAKTAPINAINIVSASNQPNAEELFLDVVVGIDIEENDDQYVYEIETDTHWYSAGGILTHNCATVEWIVYMDYFLHKDYGDDYLCHFQHEVNNHFQHVVYAINQPAAARGYQSVFWNISLYDEAYFKSIFNDFVFPDGTEPSWERVKDLQQYFMKWFNQERTKALLTFPVVTAAMLTKDGKPKDTEFAEMLAEELSEGNSFFVYMSDSADSLASCCRLRNEMTDHTFSHSNGAGGVSTGSVNVITINLNRLVQQGRDLKTEVEKIHKYQVSYLHLMKKYLKAGMLPAYDAGFIQMEKQYLTIGINGMVEAAESKGITIGNNEEYRKFVDNILHTIYSTNNEGRVKYGCMFNSEFVPAENAGAKHAKWDREIGLKVNRDCYNSYFYIVEDESINAIDKLMLHGRDYNQYLDGGSALHLNLEKAPSKESALQLFNAAAAVGCNYWCTNVKATICNKCEHIDKRTLTSCSKCGSVDIDYATRVIGYLKREKHFSAIRQAEAAKRHYHVIGR